MGNDNRTSFHRILNLFNDIRINLAKNNLKNKKIVFILLSVALICIMGCFNPDAPAEFRVYLAEEATQLDEMVLKAEPLFTVEDINSYNKETHEIALTNEIIKRMNLLAPGQLFVVSVGEERIYSGVFRWALSSTIKAEAFIDLPLTEDVNTIRISGMFSSDDLRSDERIVESLQKYNKLQ